ncbi:phosphatidylglycerol lysyltransferase domain-containing protein [Tritonibacter scottomollicae]|uniref:Phosphatidylglycerol lysyltransferase n=1 Tax=Tritonibacter scottomollicae TaxID=483013 RepID=A0A2T1AEZ6_TRISK|nr:phosphatidylglycerol lysyltransferase domain-containing protein [Tritonibacter scottomollicae]PRZ47173.1 phosphatidylglycerol lysyltransferase [Tritonibacter scottomollicae]
MTSRTTRKQTVANLLRVIAPLGIMVACLITLAGHADLPGLPELITLVRQVPLPNWIGAFGATALSFWALGRYDAVAHRHLRTNFDAPVARRAGMASIAFSQAVGFGLLSGSFARWRLLSPLSPLQSAQLTAFVGITFMTALSVICGLSLLLIAPSLALRGLGLGILILATLACALCFLHPEWRLRGLRLRPPSLQAILALMLWTLMDVGFAGIALWFLLPSGHGIELAALLPAYFLALGLAIISSSPGGAGPLELAMLALLPGAEPAALVAGLLAFRLVYYAIPAALAGALLLWPSLMRQGLAAEPEDEEDLLGSDVRPAASQPFDRPQAETGVILQNGGHVMAFGLNQVAMLDTPQISAVLFDPISGRRPEIPDALNRHARARNAAACLYKCSARLAIAARQQGWKVLRIAQDAILDPSEFSDKGSSFRQLRRKLRNAEKAGLRVEPAWSTLPLHDMAEVDHAWTRQHGCARGTTMGQFEPGYVAIQMTFLAWQEERLIGFITFHRAADEWCLDLMRQLPGAPDGTCHALLRAAIETARDAGVTRLSLAAVPDHRFADRFDRGLRQFKSCFAPSWQPRYIAAPTWPQLALALAEMIRLVHRPARPEIEMPQPDMIMRAPHVELDENAVAGKRSA